MSDNTVKTDPIVIERTFDAPINLIWELWTKPEHFKNWYGPEGLSIPVAEADFRVGGKRLVCMEMTMPDGTMTIWTTGEFTEIVPTERLVYTDSPSDENGNLVPMPGTNEPMLTTVTVELQDLGGRTKMTMTHAGLPAGQAQGGAKSGWKASFDKMAKYVATLVSE